MLLNAFRVISEISGKQLSYEMKTNYSFLLLFVDVRPKTPPVSISSLKKVKSRHHPAFSDNQSRSGGFPFLIFFMKISAASWGRRGNLNEPRGFWVCKWCFRLHSHQPGGSEERDGAAGAGQEGQHPFPRWFASFPFYWFLFWKWGKNGCKYKTVHFKLSQRFFLTLRLPLTFQSTSQTSQQTGKRSCSSSFRSMRSWPRRTTRTTSGIRRSRRCSRLMTARKQSFVAFTSNAMVSNGEPVKKFGENHPNPSWWSRRSNRRASAAAGGGSYRQELAKYSTVLPFLICFIYLFSNFCLLMSRASGGRSSFIKKGIWSVLKVHLCFHMVGCTVMYWYQYSQP